MQSLLDSVFFGEIPELQLVAVISSNANAYARKRARNAGIETGVVEPAMFPNDTSYDMAIRNKLKDMDIELVINAGFYPGVGRETAKSFRNRVIAVQPSLVPASARCCCRRPCPCSRTTISRRSSAACSPTRSGSSCPRRSSAFAPGRSGCTAAAPSCSSEKAVKNHPRTNYGPGMFCFFT